MSDLIYIVSEGAYEDEMIEYVCLSKEEAQNYVETNKRTSGFMSCYTIYELKLSTKYDYKSKDGLPTEHTIYEQWNESEVIE